MTEICRNKPFHYTQCGLDYVYLLDGVKWEKNEYGEFYSIHEVEKLHEFIAHQIITSSRPLRGQEMLFLRKQLTFSQSCLAKMMGITRDTIAKAEAKRDENISPMMDRLLRFIYTIDGKNKKSLSVVAGLLDDIAEQEYQRKLSVTHKNEIWDFQDLKAA